MANKLAENFRQIDPPKKGCSNHMYMCNLLLGNGVKDNCPPVEPNLLDTNHTLLQVKTIACVQHGKLIRNRREQNDAMAQVKQL